MEDQNKSIDRRVKRSRRLLQQSLMGLMIEKRFASITIQDITERADVNRGTFYTHFSDKYALLDSIMHEQLQQRLASKLPQISRWERKNLRILIQTILEIFREAYGRCPATELTNALMRQAVQEKIAELLLNWLKQVPAPRTGVPIETTALMISWAILGVAIEWSQREKAPSTEQMTSHILAVITEGVALLAADDLPK